MRRSMSCYESTRFTGTGKSTARIRRQKIRGTILRDLPEESECESESKMGERFRKCHGVRGGYGPSKLIKSLDDNDSTILPVFKCHAVTIYVNYSSSFMLCVPADDQCVWGVLCSTNPGIKVKLT
jgi:hypothetical protein